MIKRAFIPVIALSLFLPPAVDLAGDESFRFPGGDVEAGAKAFVSLNCIRCHTVEGVELEKPKGTRPLNLELAEETRFVESYEDLIRAITNPKHVVTKRYADILTRAEQAGEIEPLMPDMTSDMSARQLMDLVAFLDSAYAEALDSHRKSTR